MTNVTLIIKTALKYSSLNNAQSAIHHMTKPGKYSIILGNDKRFWVVTNREASILVKAGYEMES